MILSQSIVELLHLPGFVSLFSEHLETGKKGLLRTVCKTKSGLKRIISTKILYLSLFVSVSLCHLFWHLTNVLPEKTSENGLFAGGTIHLFNSIHFLQFLATLVALHFTPVSKSVSQWVVVSN